MTLNIENIINLIVAISTVFTLLVIWLTLKEMKVQRKKLYEPFLYFLKCELIFQYEYPFYRLPFRNTSLIENLKKDENEKNCGYFEVINLGEGLAKEVKIDIKWNIKYKEELNRLKDEIQKHYDNIEILFYEKAFSISIYKDDKIVASNQCHYDETSSYHIDYIIPTKIKDESIKLKFPTSLKLLLTLYTILIEINKDNNLFLLQYKSWIEELNKIDVKMHYFNNLGKMYKKTYKLDIGLPNIQCGTQFKNSIYSFPVEREKN